MAIHSPTLVSRLFTPGACHGWLWAQFVQYGIALYVMSALRDGIVRGQLIIEDSHGKHSFGSNEPGVKHPLVLMSVSSDSLWARVFLSHDMGLSEAYLNGEFDVSSLKGLFDLWLENRQTLQGLITVFSSFVAFASGLAITILGRQSLSMAVQNVVEAYDTSNELFKCFLSKEMMYSCALWDDAEHGVRGDLTVGSAPDDLHNAQMRKIKHILKKARIAPGHRLLEIGTGWGAMAIEAARQGCTVDTVTLSTQQKLLAEERAAAAGLSDRVRVHLLDYRQLPPSFKGAFDSFVSCEMVEATGLRDHPTYFKVIDWALKPHRSVAVISATTQPEFRYSNFQPDDFGRHYHWANTFLPNATYFPVTAQQAVKGRLVLHSVEDHGPHYPRTLREWARRFEQNFTGDVVAKLIEEQPQLADPHSLEAFRRKWRYMFAYAEAGYARAYSSLNCWTFARPDVKTGAIQSVLKGHTGTVWSIVFSPDSHRIVTGSNDGTSRVWDAESGNTLAILSEHRGPVWCVGFSPDGKRALVASSDATIKIYDSFECTEILSLQGHDSIANTVSYSPDGSHIASGLKDRSVQIWNASIGECLADLAGHTDNVTSVLFSPDGNNVVSSCRGMLSIWNLGTLLESDHRLV
ncbi:Tuberculostearic acid methyltransferase UfaA1 [Grifola frondosa]|uniref:Tuberculostearic acid methyltransferase UfaA1 n=1 Tax=Grifola frondosa TaxID=5627 RepID=A0A1C7MEC1_GRIFR|nr:Tuberculostearic acid methyltransferase UfaA1 [Grifola frondosa]